MRPSDKKPAPETGTATAGNEGAKIRARCAKSLVAAQAETQPCGCDSMLSGSGSHASLKTIPTPEYEAEKDLKDLTWDIFGLEENGLLLKGEDDTLRLLRLHDQIVVLRGATFNCLIACSLCLFAWGVKVWRKGSYRLYAALAVVPAVFLLFSVLALYHHFFVEHEFDPPYMEFSLFAIAVVGAFLLWLRPLWLWLEPRWFKAEKHKEERAPAAIANADAAGTENEDCFLRWKWRLLSFVFAFLFVAGVLGWWATEVMYVQQVIYSFNSQPEAQPGK